jgi:hypothetical protein
LNTICAKKKKKKEKKKEAKERWKVKVKVSRQYYKKSRKTKVFR